ncbi:CBO0543 family protein [Brevibacillus dissolubilis]|uniref:CBO0543 family protein n=1 Tax=Brevibacillus dissolubilis TaxID=1844116 RepID=UPI0011169EAB|nr:CBO0543 family protein [Brevibacillus dissolubilis]
MYEGIISLVWLGITWRSGAWREWRSFYSTILYYIIGDLLYNFVYYQHPLWTYGSSMPVPSHTWTNLWYTFFIVPLHLLNFLYFFPKSRGKAILYILAWASFYFALESLFKSLGYFYHAHGWNVGWSFAFNLMLFSMVRLHFVNPLLAWGIQAVIMLLFWSVFPVPRAYIK